MLIPQELQLSRFQLLFYNCFTVKRRKIVMKATIKIELRKDYATKEGKQMVCLRYTAYRRSTLISMNIAVLPKHWNKVSNTVRASEPRCYYYNKAISEVYQKADTIVMENFFAPLSLSQFLERLKDKHHGNTDFYVFIENEIEQLKQSRAAGTISNYYKLINTMKEWKHALSFGEITLDFIQQFHNHELEVGNILSTVYKKHSNLKFLIGIAVDKEKLAKTPMRSSKSKRILRLKKTMCLQRKNSKNYKLCTIRKNTVKESRKY